MIARPDFYAALFVLLFTISMSAATPEKGLTDILIGSLAVAAILTAVAFGLAWFGGPLLPQPG